jgi:hypothetical protein
MDKKDLIERAARRTEADKNTSKKSLTPPSMKLINP